MGNMPSTRRVSHSSHGSAATERPDYLVALTTNALAGLHLREDSSDDDSEEDAYSVGTRDWSASTAEDNSVFAHQLVAGYFADPACFGRANAASKLEFYQSMVVQFGLRSRHDMPRSITQCTQLLRTIHVNIVDYLNAVRSGRPVSSVKTYNSKADLIRAMHQQRKYIKISVAKREMLQPFLVVARGR